MSRFSSLLRRTSDRLDLPQPQKSRILLEIAADLDDLYDFYISQGMTEEDAASKASEKFDLSDEALSELIEVHESMIRRFLGLISSQARSKWEKGVLSLVILFIAAYSGKQVASRQLLRDAGGFIWPVAGFTVAAAAVAVWQFYRLYIKKDHDIRRLRYGFSWLLLAGCGSAVTGILGSSIGMYRTVGRMLVEGGSILKFIIDWGISSSALMMAALLSATAAGTIWSILAGKAGRIEEAEAAWLLEDGRGPAKTGS
jgi:hypothetical protein